MYSLEGLHLGDGSLDSEHRKILMNDCVMSYGAFKGGPLIRKAS